MKVWGFLMNSKLERLLPFLAGSTTFVAAFFSLHYGFLVLDSVKKLHEPVVNASSVLIGFSGVALSVLLSCMDKEPVKILKKLGLYQRLVTYFLSAIKSSFWVCFEGLLLILFDCNASTSFFYAFWFATLAFAAATTYRMWVVFEQILRAA